MTDDAPKPFTPEFWDVRFERDEYVYGQAPNEFLAAQAHRLPTGAVVFAPGDGEGRNGVWLAEQGCQVTTVDLSREGPRKAQALASRRGVAITAESADLLHWPWPEAAFDGV